MTNVIDRAADLLFPEVGSRVRNVKFFCGGDDNVSAVDLANQILIAEEQIRDGTARTVNNID
ncbi:MAG: hypothetical protein EOR99_28085 [Mesorhizobium sp.]|uniref:hypothetical protein n=1 Tax=unclassified Mesorhizobium TaxID=325217 RepID=UPI000FE8051E|nr:hypothetical protein [Mesorhizobium sp.]RWM76904.1 MAG: hypothetical protein EOR81_20935 [Mesorhizobium sp.]RWN53614.1 MAG: hypothetical protein EOS00_30665 [Mesorhizobium sp.]RWN62897.1 MAG: hypothetical protein EOR99_28085 [Mesorhizobium sp.]TIR30443.1 MAG: hypothetical protein E5X35_22525 [Mesorhizobium sp.]TIY11734.1 MAG: hypothetical protein E5V16_03585 [Mesorhizobium sp.]